MRPVLTEEEITQFIRQMPLQEVPWIENNRERQQAFKEIILYGDSRDLIRLVRNLHLRREEQVAKGKSFYAADERIFKDAENIVFEGDLLCSEHTERQSAGLYNGDRFTTDYMISVVYSCPAAKKYFEFLKLNLK